MDDPSSVTIIIILFCLLFSAFFSGMEIAFISSSSLKVEIDKKQEKLSGILLSRFFKRPSQFIGVMLLGNNITLVLYGILMGDLVSKLWLSSFNLTEVSELALQTIISTFFVLIFAEFLPKAIFRINPNKTLSVFALPVTIIYYMLIPVSFVIIGATEWVLKTVFGVKFSSSETVYKKIDIEHYIEEHTQNGSNNGEDVEHEIQIFKNALNFAQVKTRDCMVPRNEIVAIEVDANIDELRDKFIETEHSKILVYKETIDNIIGYAHSYEMFKSPRNVRNILLPIHIVPETAPIEQVLKQLTAKNRSIAVVVDEFGGTAGILTIEDIIEQIFGEIEDEHDVDELYEKEVEDGELILSGRLEIDYINEKYQLDLPEQEDYETLAGLVLYKTQDIPEINDIVEINDYQLQVLEVSNTKIELIKVKRSER
jgi:CBS domain containing-hemolysin-like protein